MLLGEKILKLRKKIGLSQEQLAEQVDVTRQTISNWELDVTAPNPKQLKILSKILNVSIDELLDNESKEVLMKKISNTEKLAGMIIKILKVIGIIIISYLVVLTIAIIGLMIYTYNVKAKSDIKSKITTTCEIENTKYEIIVGSNQSFACDQCSVDMEKQLKEIINFDHLEESSKRVEDYFLSNGASCK